MGKLINKPHKFTASQREATASPTSTGLGSVVAWFEDYEKRHTPAEVDSLHIDGETKVDALYGDYQSWGKHSHANKLITREKFTALMMNSFCRVRSAEEQAALLEAERQSKENRKDAWLDFFMIFHAAWPEVKEKDAWSFWRDHIDDDDYSYDEEAPWWYQHAEQEAAEQEFVAAYLKRHPSAAQDAAEDIWVKGFAASDALSPWWWREDTLTPRVMFMKALLGAGNAPVN